MCSSFPMYHGQNGDDTAADDWKIPFDIKFLKNPLTNSKGLTLDLKKIYISYKQISYRSAGDSVSTC